MKNLNKTQIKNQILASKLNNLRTTIYEASLREALFHFFNKLYKRLDKAIQEYWNDDFMFQGQIELILATIHESQREYYNILLKHNLKEYRKARKQGKRLVKLAQTKAKQHSIKADKAETTNITKLIKPIFNNQKELFQTSNNSLNQLETQTFKASEITMNRIDQEINTILADGYKSGKGINHVRDQIHKRFNQLKTWESERIARTEIHDAQTMGVMQSYNEMNVEYVEWDSAHDARVRTAKDGVVPGHDELSGEIIPLGATFSNGLTRPGDRNGPIKQWINCRCGLLPFIIPDGYIAPPGKIPFREEDLIPTLDLWNQDELIQEVMSQQEPVPTISSEEEVFLKRWKRNYGKEESETAEEFYSRLSKRYEKLIVEREYNTGGKLKNLHNQELKALEHSYPKEYQKMLDNVVKEVDENRLTRGQRESYRHFKQAKAANSDEYRSMKDAIDSQLNEFETIIKDTNIHTEKVTLNLADEAPGYEGLKEETFMKYTFKDKNYEIYISEKEVGFNLENGSTLYPIRRESWQTPYKIMDHIEKQPVMIRDSYKQVIVSNNRKISLKGRFIRGWSNNQGRVVSFIDDENYFKVNLTHEGAHNLELGIHKISSDPEYIEAFLKDHNARMKGEIELTELPKNTLLKRQEENKIWISEYAGNPINTKAYELVEDWADSVVAYVHEPGWFRHNYPNKFKYIDKLFKEGHLNSVNSNLRNTMPMSEMKISPMASEPIVENKLPLTVEEQEHYLKLKAKQDKGEALGFLERTPMKKYENQIEFNKFYAKYGTDTPSDLTEYKAYKKVLTPDVLKKLGVKDVDEFFYGPKKVIKKPIRKPKSKPQLKTSEYEGKVYKDYTEIREEIESHMEELQSKIKYTSEQIEATMNYGQEWFKAVNDYLWGNPTFEKRLIEYGIPKSKVLETIEHLDAAIKKSPGLDDHIVLWKGGTSKNINLEKNAINTWDAFASSSFDKDVAIDYYEDHAERIIQNDLIDEKPLLFKIRAKKGTNGVFMDSNLQGTTGESELLLNHGQKFKIIDTYIKEGRNVCEIELI